MAETLTKDDVTVAFPGLQLSGRLVHDRAHGVLELITEEGPERLSANLMAYGLVAGPGCVWIKDWSEHEGLAHGLADQGLVELVGQMRVGPFASKAYEALVLID